VSFICFFFFLVVGDFDMKLVFELWVSIGF
jgi:hypothetical protein